MSAILFRPRRVMVAQGVWLKLIAFVGLRSKSIPLSRASHNSTVGPGNRIPFAASVVLQRLDYQDVCFSATRGKFCCGWLLSIHWHQRNTEHSAEKSQMHLKASLSWYNYMCHHDDVIKWKHFPLNWPFVRGIHRSPVNSLHKGLWRGALMFSLICARIDGWVNNREVGDLRRHRAHYDVIVMSWKCCLSMTGFCAKISICKINDNRHGMSLWMFLL